MSRRAAAAGVALAGLALWAGLGLTRLARAETSYRRVADAAAPPRLAVLDGQALPATDTDQARRDLAQRIGDAGAAVGVRLSLTPVADPLDGVVALRIDARGGEAALLRLSATVEQGATPIRWTRWAILPDGEGGLRLTADAAAPWVSRRRSASAATGPIVTLAVTSRSALPGRMLFASSPITGDSAGGNEGAPRLVGIAGRLPDDAVAMLRLADGTTRSLRRGEAVEGWTVGTIAADRVRLTRAGRDHVEILPPTSADQ